MILCKTGMSNFGSEKEIFESLVASVHAKISVCLTLQRSWVMKIRGLVDAYYNSIII